MPNFSNLFPVHLASATLAVWVANGILHSHTQISTQMQVGHTLRATNTACTVLVHVRHRIRVMSHTISQSDLYHSYVCKSRFSRLDLCYGTVIRSFTAEKAVKSSRSSCFKCASIYLRAPSLKLERHTTYISQVQEWVSTKRQLAQHRT